MWSNVKKSIANAQDRLQRIQNELEQVTNTGLGHKLDKTMLNMMVKQMQVSEVYSPPRVVEVANRMGLRGGWSLDLTTQDEQARPWAFNNRAGWSCGFLRGSPP